MSHHEEKNQAAKAKEKQNQYGNAKPQNQQGKQPGQPGQPGSRPQGDGREVDSAAQLRWSENERNERNERGERNERNTYDR